MDSNMDSSDIDSSLIGNDQDYFTIAYILLTTAIVMQVIYYSFVVYSYQDIKKKLAEKGRLLQIAPILNIATVCVQPNQLIYAQPNCSATSQVPVYPGSARVIDNKVAPPPYVP